MKSKKILIVFSGGQDSTTCLYWAKNRFKQIEAVTFVYGQKHSEEIDCAKDICKKENIKQHIIDISFLDTIVESALTSNGDVNKLNDKGLPASFVPNRNQMFITIAHSLAQKIFAKNLVIGVCQTDYSGYPDCRGEYIKAIEKVTNLGSESDIEIITPVIDLTKEEIFLMAKKEGCLDEVIKLSHTCYNNNHKDFHEWGYGCDDCPACNERKKGYKKFLKL